MFEAEKTLGLNIYPGLVGHHFLTELVVVDYETQQPDQFLTDRSLDYFKGKNNISELICLSPTILLFLITI